MSHVTETLTLPSGSVLKNRLAKSAMNEALSTLDGSLTATLPKLYSAWAKGGTGLLFTGNVMVDRDHRGADDAVAIDQDTDFDLLKQWAQAGTENNAQIWMQINHPGKQIPKSVTPNTLAPSAIGFEGMMGKVFAVPRALEESEIWDIIQKFVFVAEKAKEAGFTGVQIHAAHGYLASQFLSPLHNQRTDQWGGSLENRMRFVVEIYKHVRAAVGSDFNVGVKINSADFQRGGFSEEESMIVAQKLSELGMDLIEVSGGTYEAPEMVLGSDSKKSTQEREAYFLEYAEKVRSVIKSPLMVTGGFRTTKGINDALASQALDVVGLARPLVLDPSFSNKLLANENVKSEIRTIKTGIKFVDEAGILETAWYALQMKKIAQGKKPKNQPGLLALGGVVIQAMKTGVRKKLA